MQARICAGIQGSTISRPLQRYHILLSLIQLHRRLLTKRVISLDDHLGVRVCATCSSRIVLSTTSLSRCCCIERLLEVGNDVVDEFRSDRDTDEVLLLSVPIYLGEV